MKRMLCLILALVLLCGCQSAAAAPTGQNAGNNNEATVDATEIETPDVTLPKNEQLTIGGENTGIENGCVRVEYNGNISSVRYITSVEQLPDHEALAGYDAAYFENKALLVVRETVTSGSVKVGIASVEEGVVTLSYNLAGIGTSDMAAWLLWMEVEAGLEYDWSVANPAVKLETSTH